MTIVDAHVHLWDLSRFSLSWFRDDMGLPQVASASAVRAAAASRPEQRASPLVEQRASPRTEQRTCPLVEQRTGPLVEHRTSPRTAQRASPLVERARNERDETPQPALSPSPVSDSAHPVSDSAHPVADSAHPVADPAHPVTTAIAVQAGDTLPEMCWLLEVAAADPVVRSVVLQYVPDSDGWAGLATSVLNDRVRGIRVATPGGAADLSDIPGLDALCEGAAASGRVIEWLVRPAQLAAVARVAVRHPHTMFVLCHLGLGAAEPTPEWEDSLRRVAAVSRTATKFSGLARNGGDDGRLAALAATASTLFGSDRVMFGSDWPMSARALSYERLVAQVERAWGAGSSGFWGAVAGRIYGL